MKVAVDASRNRSGGAVAHIVGLISHSDPGEAGISEVHLFAPPDLLKHVPKRPWLHPHSPAALTRGMVSQLWWQAVELDRQVRALGCSVLFTTSASSVSQYSPSVVLSQDLSSYEPGVMGMHKGRERLRLEVIKILQNRAFRRADCTLFLTEYSAKVIQMSCGPVRASKIVPHGVNPAFAEVVRRRFPTATPEDPVSCVYVSNAMMYKHQCEVLKAIRMLRDQGVFVTVSFIGGGVGEAMRSLRNEVARQDPEGAFVRLVDALPTSALIEELSSSDIFVFASACENLPITLLEGMRAGLPIVCSSRGPMPEVLGEGGLYFDPAEPASIADAVSRLIGDRSLRDRLSNAARGRSGFFTWERCGQATWAALAHVGSGGRV